MPPSRGKLAQQIARTIEAEIVEAGWPVGTSLGSEPALIERHRVSRAVMREAVRILESHGVAQMRLGPGGGLTVTAPSVEVVLEQLALLLNHAEITTQDMFEVTGAIELISVELATQRIDEARIAELRALLEEEQRTVDGHSIALHLAIAAATGNPALRLLLEINYKLIDQLTPPGVDPIGGLDDAHGEHAAIVAAIVAGDAPLAQHRVRRHLATTLRLNPTPESSAP